MSKKQVTIALSSCEAEYYAIADGIKEIINAKQIISEMFRVVTPVSHWVDNIGAGYMAQNAINNKRTKHIDIRFHFIRHYLKEKLVERFYVASKENVADLLTKALPSLTFIYLTKIVMGNSG